MLPVWGIFLERNVPGGLGILHNQICVGAKTSNTCGLFLASYFKVLNIDIPIIVHIQVNCGSQYINNVDIPNMQSVDVTSGKSQHPLSHAIYPPGATAGGARAHLTVAGAHLTVSCSPPAPAAAAELSAAAQAGRPRPLYTGTDNRASRHHL